MRLALFAGLITIAGAIRPEAIEEQHILFYAAIIALYALWGDLDEYLASREHE